MRLASQQAQPICTETALAVFPTNSGATFITTSDVSQAREA